MLCFCNLGVHTLCTTPQYLAGRRDSNMSRWYHSVGWVDFALFLEFHQKSRVGGSPRYKMEKYQIFMTLVQKPVRATTLKVHNFKKIKGAKNKKFFLKNVFFNAYIILEDNQIFKKNIFLILFYFLKRVLFQKTSFA